jgi:hypothetical protein
MGRSRRAPAPRLTRGFLVAATLGALTAGCARSSSAILVLPSRSTVVTVPTASPTVAPSRTAAPAGLPSTAEPNGVATAPSTTTTAVTTAVNTSAMPSSTNAPPRAAPRAKAPVLCGVSFVGDSLGAGLDRNGLAAALDRVGCLLVWKDAYGGMPIGVGATLLEGARHAPSNVVLVMLGFHNARSEVGRDLFPGRIDAVVTAAHGRLVVWPMPASTDDCSAGYQRALARADDELRAATLRWPNLLLVDYPAFLAPHPEYSEHRCPHLLPFGYAAVNGWLAGEVRRLVDLRGP